MVPGQTDIVSRADIFNRGCACKYITNSGYIESRLRGRPCSFSASLLFELINVFINYDNNYLSIPQIVNFEFNFMKV